MAYIETGIQGTGYNEFARKVVWHLHSVGYKFKIKEKDSSKRTYILEGSPFGEQQIFKLADGKYYKYWTRDTLEIEGVNYYFRNNWTHDDSKSALPIIGLMDYVKDLTKDRYKIEDKPSSGIHNYYLMIDSSIPAPTTSDKDDAKTLHIADSNLILYGPPGTGKTYHTIEKAVEIITGVPSRSYEDSKKLFEEYKKKKQIVFTTFHQSMCYEDFIEGIKPVLGGDSLSYEIEDGIFKQISNAAKEKPYEKYVLIIDEINRGNVANIFGELITLIEEDKRLGNSEEMTCKLPYSKGEFGVPNNLYIIGTMNTADRSVEALDTALRRRFTFEEMMPKPELLKEKETDVGINLTDFLNVINKRISLLKDREHQIGHSYFMNVDSKDALIDVIFKNVIPLLQEYFYGDYEKIQMVLGDKFIHREKPRTEFAIKDGNFGNPEYIYSIVKPKEITADIDAALESINFGFSKPDGEEPAEGTGDAE